MSAWDLMEKGIFDECNVMHFFSTNANLPRSSNRGFHDCCFRSSFCEKDGTL